ncbi:MAG: NUDIX domain-containing protein [Candidatus Saccharibacteria bacterium]|nr:NUDIX domain-containing protein [Candidatus Saccharibacteria bacterium]
MPEITIAEDEIDKLRGIDYIGVTINFLVHDGKGNILLQKRSKNCRDEQGRWDIGGGAVEFGETLDEAVIREVREEYRTEPIELELNKVFTALREHEGMKTHWVGINYTVLVDPETVSIGEPHKADELGWFGADSLPDPMHSMFHIAHEIALAQNILR